METDSMIMDEDEVIIIGHQTNQALNVIVVISSGIIAMNVERIWVLQKEKRLIMQKMSNHMSGDKTIFSALDESFRDSVWFGNDMKVCVLGKGEAMVVMEHNVTHNMSSVLYMPDLKTNILSIGQL
ncbi:hypothetical protein Tco_0628595 [Tanacetum coccineum]|uniref:Retrovirus-related Pol polyprotein from transposon TNT 1-94-like beta-barrel domain-containing protein n=1 Tax=Tanacetum coccineum TaxID=301880 RepID=A0ABQ4WQZ1_9ASTR